MIFGFGDGEKREAIRVLEETAKELKGVMEKSKIECILESLSKKCKDRTDKNDKLDKNDAPERYSYYWTNLMYNHKDSFVVLYNFHHINRRHPFSSDGWALLSTKWMLEFYGIDNVFRIYEQVA